jgi:hypothetical protein
MEVVDAYVGIDLWQSYASTHYDEEQRRGPWFWRHDGA